MYIIQLYSTWHLWWQTPTSCRDAFPRNSHCIWTTVGTIQTQEEEYNNMSLYHPKPLAFIASCLDRPLEWGCCNQPEKLQRVRRDKERFHTLCSFSRRSGLSGTPLRLCGIYQKQTFVCSGCSNFHKQACIKTKQKIKRTWEKAVLTPHPHPSKRLHVTSILGRTKPGLSHHIWEESYFPQPIFWMIKVTHLWTLKC